MTKVLIGTEKDYQDIILKAKKEVFDDIDNHIGFWVANNKDSKPDLIEPDWYKMIKKRHLSTFAEQKRHNSSSKKDCQHNNIQVSYQGKASYCKDCGEEM